VSPIFKGSDDGKHFFVIDLIIAFDVNYRLRAISDWVSKIVVQSLEEYASSGETRGIDLKMSGLVWFPHGKDGFVREHVFESLKYVPLRDSSLVGVKKLQPLYSKA